MTAIVAFGAVVGMSAASAQYFRRPVSDINPAVMQIDEKAVLGKSMDPGVELLDQNGNVRRWEDFRGKPTILVLSYYTCDGSCTTVNSILMDLLAKAPRQEIGKDFNVLTVSFDRRDKLETTGAFKAHLNLTGALADRWTFATFRNESDVAPQTEKIGFKFFWSPADQIFLHPGAFLFFSPEGKMTRVLYQDEVEGFDVEMALLDAREGQFKPHEIVNFALSLCYSYNYQDGKYRLNIPLFVGLGAFLFGVITFASSLLIFRFRHMKQPKGA